MAIKLKSNKHKLVVDLPIPMFITFSKTRNQSVFVSKYAFLDTATAVRKVQFFIAANKNNKMSMLI